MNKLVLFTLLVVMLAAVSEGLGFSFFGPFGLSPYSLYGYNYFPYGGYKAGYNFSPFLYGGYYGY